MEVVLLLSAERDLQEPYNWVEEHRQGGEQYFLQDVDLRLEHLKMRSSISAKIPKRSESAFPNREYFTLICLLEAIFVFNQIVD